MKRDDLIQKWLDNSLSPEEFEAFKQLEDADDLLRLDRSLKSFKAPSFDTDSQLESVLTQIKSAKKTNIIPWAFIAKTAAVILLSLSVYYYSTTLDSNFSTDIAELEVIALPDASTATLNAGSQLAFNTHNWTKKRTLQLDGEAFFKVSKGSKFDVETPIAVISVLGTEFNVNYRSDFFEVMCYEGLVSVTFQHTTTKLGPGERIRILGGQIITSTQNKLESTPSWINHNSTFQSIPYAEVLAEFERQYAVSINVQDIDKSQLFTGSFSHENMETALKSITLPLRITYTINGDTVILKGE